jgi:hypothetical protein
MIYQFIVEPLSDEDISHEDFTQAVEEVYAPSDDDEDEADINWKLTSDY